MFCIDIRVGGELICVNLLGDIKMSIATLAQLPFTAAGNSPKLWFIQSNEDFSVITNPGYLNNVGGAGINIEKNCFVLASYASDGGNLGLFVVTSDSDGVLTMNEYNPNSNSFIFNRVRFVAQGGSDSNAGNTMGSPKLTIGAAITSLNPGTVTPSLVWVLDAHRYDENLVLPNNVIIYAPNAALVPGDGDALSINDTGNQTLAEVTFSSIISSSKAIAISGPNSQMIVTCPIVQGDIGNEGILTLDTENLIGSSVNTSAGSYNYLYIQNASSCTFDFDPASQVLGNIQTVTDIGDTGNIVYGNTSFNDRLVYQQSPSTETAGRTVAIGDSNTRIVYNSASGGSYTLPQTSDVAIPIGTNIEFVQLGIGAVTFVAGSGVTVVSESGANVSTNGSGTVARTWKYTDTIWVIDGDVIAPA